jgi:hypothetical protein
VGEPIEGCPGRHLLPVGDQVVGKAPGEERLDLRNCARTLSNGHVES